MRNTIINATLATLLVFSMRAAHADSPAIITDANGASVSIQADQAARVVAFTVTPQIGRAETFTLMGDQADRLARALRAGEATAVTHGGQQITVAEAGSDTGRHHHSSPVFVTFLDAGSTFSVAFEAHDSPAIASAISSATHQMPSF